MMQIAVELDRTEEEIDTIDPIGDITLTDGKTTILEESTYLDSWFEALIAGLKSVQQGKNAKVEILEEPEPLVFEALQKGMRLSYHNQAIALVNVAEFSSALKLAANDFLEKLSYMNPNNRNDLLDLVRDFVNKSSDK